jgi:hypothetical protein
MRAVMPWLEEADAPTCRTWAELASRVYAALRDQGVLNPEGEARRLLDDYRKLRQTQAIFTRELGMTPAARQALKANSKATFDLAPAFAAEDVSVAVTDKVIDVAKSRGKIVHENSDGGGSEDDGGSKTDGSDPTD